MNETFISGAQLIWATEDFLFFFFFGDCWGLGELDVCSA